MQSTEDKGNEECVSRMDDGRMRERGVLQTPPTCTSNNGTTFPKILPHTSTVLDHASSIMQHRQSSGGNSDTITSDSTNVSAVSPMQATAEIYYSSARIVQISLPVDAETSIKQLRQRLRLGNCSNRNTLPVR